MNKSEAYCRLCSEIKSTTKLINLEDGTDMARDVYNKLQMANFTELDLRENLPKTICFLCKNSLDTVAQFVRSVDTAQQTLRAVCRSIKREMFSDDANSDDVMSFPEDFAQETANFKDECKVKAEPSTEVKPQPIVEKKTKKAETSDSWSVHDTVTPLSNLKTTWKTYSWLCTVCEVQFSTLKELVCHSMLVHKLCTTFRCTDCKVRKLRLEKFVKHIRGHRKQLKFGCYICLKQFKNTSQAAKHVDEHNSGKFPCPGCGTSFETMEELSNHKEQFYTDRRATRMLHKLKMEGEEPICKICNKLFLSHNKLYSHMKIHDSNRKTYICDKCGRPYYQKISLQEHMMLHDNIKPFTCKICNMSFLSLARLKLHVRTHENIKPFPCEQCGKLFRLKKQLQNHMIVHTDEMPFSCLYCEKQFKFKSRLNQHLIQHTGIKPYSCSVCERDFTNWPNYNKHMKRRHDMNMAKKQHTSEGVMPINPLTGKVEIVDAKEAEEFKKSVLSASRKKYTRV